MIDVGVAGSVTSKIKSSFNISKHATRRTKAIDIRSNGRVRGEFRISDGYTMGKAQVRLKAL